MGKWARFFFLTTLLFFTQAGFPQEVDTLSPPAIEPTAIELRSFVESSTVPLNRRVIFHIELSWIGDLSRYHIENIPQPILTNLSMEGSGSVNKLEPLVDGRYRAVKMIDYQFKPLEMGMAYIDGISIEYRDNLTGKSDVLQSQRVMVEIVEPLPEEGGQGMKALIYIILLVLFFGSLLYFSILYVKRRREARKRSVPVISPAQTFLNHLAQEVDPKGTNLAEMTLKLSRIFREFLAQEFKFPAKEASTEELISRLEKAELEAGQLEQLKQLFEKFDLIKFAGNEVDPADFSNLYGTIEAFLMKRKQVWDAQQAQEKEA